jgi:nitrogen fixation/metabolism regulation signal transduction histidine kinase
VILLGATVVAFVRLLSSGQYITLAACGALIVYQLYSLVRYVEFTNRNLTLFLQSIEFADLSHRLHPGPMGQTFADLGAAFEDALSKFQEMRVVEEETLGYLDAVVQHVGIGILTFDSSGDVEVLNSSARSLLDIAALKNIGDLKSAFPQLHEKLRDLEPGNRDLVAIRVGGDVRQISIHAAGFRRRDKQLKLVSMQNIGIELDEKEMDAWRNMIRVLTHEIKNSLTPIASLAASVEKLTSQQYEKTADTTAPQAEKIRDALQIIQKRSQGLLDFVDTYRDLTHLPPPKLSVFQVGDLFTRVEQLVAPRVKNGAATIRIAIDPPSMTLAADQQMIEQSLINLLLNALEATEGQSDADVSLEASYDEKSRPVIEVTDNGPGVVAESLEKIFVPFYSTKKDGSGIGLSLSRQIMRLHRGSLTAQSSPGARTVFTMRF